MVRVSGLNASLLSGRFWCAAILTAASAIGVASRADAALYDLQDPEPGFYRPGPPIQTRRQKLRLPFGKKAIEKETAAKPQGPLVIAVSIGRQQVKIYDADGLFAEAPVSTGMPGHSTPTGVFSVIQKHRLHHSNIYSGAPMPYMQRITWSGVAMHAGVLPGYPASHGCIRMPTGFAVKMWNWTKMGARVIVTPGEISTPVSFSHPLLPSLKVAPQPLLAEEPHDDAPLAAKADKGREAKPSTAATNLELRSTVGHGNAVTPVAEMTPVTLRDQTHTANANDANSMVTMSDAPSGNDAAMRDAAKPEAAESSKPSEAASSEAKSVEGKPIETSVAETKPDADHEAATDKAVSLKVEDRPVEAKAEAPKQDIAKTDTAKTETVKTETVKTETTKTDTTKNEPTTAEPAKADIARSSEKPTETVKAADAGASAPDGKKDQSRLAKPEAPKRTGQIAVFISRKDAKIYVRQNFAPLFEAPVTIASSDRPLGTHVFTAEVDKSDSNVLHWSAVSLPSSVRSAMRDDNEEHGARRRKGSLAAEARSLLLSDSATEALDRIAIAPDTMARISEALTTGGSIIVSDQGVNQGETGEGTDFIVSLR
jgi:lipoprotein-anchoring transpeptidase ErfK/SrfK